MSDRWLSNRLFGELLLVVLALRVVGPWLVNSIAVPGRRPWWLVALVGVGFVAYLAYTVAGWFALPPADQW